LNSEVNLPVFIFINGIPDKNFEDNGRVSFEIYLQSLQFHIIHLPVGNVEVKIYITAMLRGHNINLCLLMDFLNLGRQMPE
jgi:hypothetical protein